MNTPSSNPSVGSASPTTDAPRRVAVVNARPGDHPLVLQFLSSECPHWSADALRASFDDPQYEPSDRLLIKLGTRLIGHAHTTRRSMQFGATRLPAGQLQCMLVAPEFRRQGLGHKLVEAAARAMSHHGSLVALARTSAPALFEKTGWGVVGVDHRSEISTQALLSGMLTHGLLPKKRHCRLSVRLWRRMELEAICRIYNRNLPGSFGPMERTAATWRWLIDSGSSGQLYVASSGPADPDIEASPRDVVAYAAVRGGRILELLTSPGRRAAAVPLVARLCREAIERDRRELVLYAPPTDQLHALFQLAGGRTEAEQPDAGQSIVARVLAPAKLLRQIGPELYRRGEAAGVELPFRWGLSLDRRSYVVTLDSQGATVTAGGHAENRLRLASRDLAPLVLGRLDWQSAQAAGRLVVRGKWMQQAGPVLFPSQSLWCPLLDSFAGLA